MEISLAAEQVAHLGPLPITNSMILSWIVSAGLILVTTFSLRNLKSIPTGVQNFFETIIELLFNLANSILDDEKATKKYFALVATIFIFIVTNNWIGLVPGVGSIGITEHGKFIPLLRGANADLNTTLALAIVAVIAIQIFGVAAIGTFKYAKKFINFNGPINFFIGIIELISEFAKMISFSFRLFGNIFAGEVLLTIVAFLVPLIAPLPFFALELFVGAVQALVFSMLVLVFIKMAITEVSH